MKHASRFLLLTAIVLAMATAALCDSAEDFFNSGRAQQAKVNLQDALNTDRDSLIVWQREAIADLDGAVADYTKAIEIKPTFAEAYYQRGMARQAKVSAGLSRGRDAKADWGGAIADYTKAIELRPDFADAYYVLGLSIEASGDVYILRGNKKAVNSYFGNAIAYFSKTIELNSNHAGAYYHRGLAKQVMGDIDGARADCTKSIELTRRMRVNPKDGLTYVWIEPGTFLMGYYLFPEDTLTHPHQVTFTKGFWIGQTVVTQEAYQRVTGANPSHLKGPKLPVESVGWNQAQSYCQAVGMRLPSEAEWEYAARAGSTSATQYGDISQIKSDNDEPANAVSFKPRKPAEVMEKLPNEWGVYDIFGNVYQWIAGYPITNSQKTSETDPQGATNSSPGQAMLVLGGTKWNRLSEFRQPSRGGAKPEIGGYDPRGMRHYLGFRCAGY